MGELRRFKILYLNSTFIFGFIYEKLFNTFKYKNKYLKTIKFKLYTLKSKFLTKHTVSLLVIY